MSFKIEGLDQLSRKLKDLEARARALDGTHQVRAEEMFTHDFMRRHTPFRTFSEMVRASGFTVESAEDFAAIPDQDWDTFVRQATSFSSWEAMQAAAGREWVAAKMGLR